MAHVHTHSLMVKVSRLAKGDHAECNDSNEPTFSNEILESLESVVSELLNDPNLIVELIRCND